MAQTVASSMFDLAQQNPEETTTLAGHSGGLAQAGSAMLGDSSTLGTYLGGYGNLAGGASNLVSGVSNLREGNTAGGLGDLASGATSLMSMHPALMSSAPLLGAVGGMAQTIGHGMEAYKHSDKINDAYSGNKFWNEAGATGLSAVNTVAALDPTGISSMMATGTQLGVDGLGMASGYLGKKLFNTDTSFTASSALGHAGHLAYDTASMVGTGLGKVGSGASWLYNQMPSIW